MGAVAIPNFQVPRAAEMEARPTYSLNAFLCFILSFFVNRTRKTIKRQVSQFQRHLQTFYAPLRDNFSYGAERVGEIEREGGARRASEQGALNAKLFTIVKLRARLWVHAHSHTRTHRRMDKKLGKNLKKLNYLYALVGYRSVCQCSALRSLPQPFSLQRARPEARRTKMQICVWSVRCKYATHFNRKGLPQCEIFLQRFLRFLLRIIIA